jgi:5-(carboxyamino)imidazole ribonucleotide synthase
MKLSHKDKFTLGVYGDGQLARLTAIKALEKNLSVVFYSLNKKLSPCKDLGPIIEGKSWDDKESFERFCQSCSVIVLENEFVPESFLLSLPDEIPVIPNAESYSALSDKLKQVRLAESLTVPVPRYSVIEKVSDLGALKLPVMLKSLRGGYDGYGNFLFGQEEKRKEAEAFIEDRGISLAQEFIRFDSEVAILVARDGKNTVTFPVVETIQENNICHFVISPPRFSVAVQEKVAHYAKALIEKIDGRGLFGLEFFVKGDEVIFNEIAPRPHNSGHYSIDACNLSQYEAIVNIALGEPLHTPVLKTRAVGMLNLLGTQNGKAHFKGDERFQHQPQGYLHLYGKEESRKGRKMGHYTLMGDETETILEELKDLKTRYEI